MSKDANGDLLPIPQLTFSHSCDDSSPPKQFTVSLIGMKHNDHAVMATSLSGDAIAIDNEYYLGSSDFYPGAATAQPSMLSNLAHESAHVVYADLVKSTGAESCVTCLTSKGPNDEVDECDEAFAYAEEAKFACSKANEVDDSGSFVLPESNRINMKKQADGACEKCATFTEQCQLATSACAAECPSGPPTPCPGSSGCECSPCELATGEEG